MFFPVYGRTFNYLENDVQMISYNNHLLEASTRRILKYFMSEISWNFYLYDVMLNDINLFSHGRYYYVVWYLSHTHSACVAIFDSKIRHIIMISFMRNPFVVIFEDIIKITFSRSRFIIWSIKFKTIQNTKR